LLVCHDPTGSEKGKVESAECQSGVWHFAFCSLHSAVCILQFWQAALVLPQARRVLETPLRKLAHGLFEWRIQNAERRIGSMKHQDLKSRTQQFALRIIAFCEGLPKDDTSKILGRQLLRAGCSVGANYRAACRAKSKADFISKMGTMLEEADETGYWIELLAGAGKVKGETAAPLLNESGELVAIAIASINTARRNAEGRS
jgi:four helix bundle protein